MIRIRSLLPITGFWLLFAGSAMADPPRRIPMEDFFKNPQSWAAKISPDGKHIAFLAPDQNRMNIWVCETGVPFDSAKPATHDATRGIFEFTWTRDSRYLLYSQDSGGDENTHLFRADPFAPEKPPLDFTPVAGTKAKILHLPRNLPGIAIILWNKSDRRFFEIGILNIYTGAYQMAVARPFRPESSLFEPSGVIAANLLYTRDNKVDIQVLDRVEGSSSQQPSVPSSPIPSRPPEASPPGSPTPPPAPSPRKRNYHSVATFGPLDRVNLWGMNADRSILYLSTNRDSNTERLIALDLKTGQETVIDEDPEYDIFKVIVSDRSHRLLGAVFEKERFEVKAFDPEFQRDLDILTKTLHGSVQISSSMSDDEQKWLVGTRSPSDPVSVYLYDRTSGEVKFLCRPYPWLNPDELAEVKPVAFESRDGWKLHGYLTLPRGVAPTGLPAVLMVHGGPGNRDHWGYYANVQFLANRGFAVLQINFRGSTGYGGKFYNAGDREWGGKMLDDLIDGANWIVKQGVADPKRLGIVGASYGGYAALSALAFHPEVFACGVDSCGPSNLITFLESVPPYWIGDRSRYFRQIGNPEKDADFMRSRSPLFSADKIRAPLFIAQGENDPRVKRAESDQMVEAVRKNGTPVEYLLIPDEGHSLFKAEDRLEFNAKMEAFLEKYLK